MNLKRLISVIILLIILIIPACTIIKQADGGFKVGVTPETHQTISDAGDAATTTLGLLSAFFPALLPIAAAAGVGTATWKKMKKTVTKYKGPLEMYVKTLEYIKQNDEETWAKIKEEIKSYNPTAFAKNTIEELKEELDRQGSLVTES